MCALLTGYHTSPCRGDLGMDVEDNFTAVDIEGRSQFKAKAART